MWQCCHLTKGHLLRWLHLHLLWRFVFILRKRFNWPQFGKQPALALSKFQNAQQANRQTSKQKVHLGLVHRQQTNKQTKSSPWSCSSCCSCCRPPSLLSAPSSWDSPKNDQSLHAAKLSFGEKKISLLSGCQTLILREVSLPKMLIRSNF